MVKNVFGILASFIILFSFFSLVIARENSDVEKGERKFKPQITVMQKQRLEERQEKLEELKDRLSDKRATISAKLTERKKLNIQRHWGKLTARLSAAIDRLDTLIQRIGSRLATIEENNPETDTTDIKEQLAKAKTELIEAKAKLAALEELADEAFDSDNPNETFLVVSGGVREIKSLLVSVHRTLVHLIGDVKGLRVGQEDLNGVTVTPTVAVTSTLTPTQVLTLTPTLTLTPSPEPTFTPTI